MDEADLESLDFNDPLPGECSLNILRIHISTNSDQFFPARKIVRDAPVHEVSRVKNLFHVPELRFDHLLEIRVRFFQVGI